jgi:hypothetical protein
MRKDSFFFVDDISVLIVFHSPVVFLLGLMSKMFEASDYSTDIGSRRLDTTRTTGSRPRYHPNHYPSSHSPRKYTFSTVLLQLLITDFPLHSKPSSHTLAAGSIARAFQDHHSMNKFAADGEYLIVAAEDQGCGRVFFVSGGDVATGAGVPRPLTNSGTAVDVRCLADGRVFVSGSSMVDDSWYTTINNPTTNFSQEVQHHPKRTDMVPLQLQPRQEVRSPALSNQQHPHSRLEPNHHRNHPLMGHQTQLFRQEKKIPRRLPHPRWPPRSMARRLEHPLEPGRVRRAGIHRGRAECFWEFWVWAGFHGLELSKLGRRSVSRSCERF